MRRPTFTAVCNCGWQGFSFEVTPGIVTPQGYARTQASLHQRASGGVCIPTMLYQTESENQ